MLYLIDGKYYMKSRGYFRQVNVYKDINGINFTPAGHKIEVSPNVEFEEILIDDLNFDTKKEEPEKVKEEKPRKKFKR